MSDFDLKNMLKVYLNYYIQIDNIDVKDIEEGNSIVIINKKLVLFIQMHKNNQHYFIKIFEMTNNPFYKLTQSEALSLIYNLHKEQQLNRVHILKYKRYCYDKEMIELHSIAKKYVDLNIIGEIDNMINCTFIIFEFYYQDDIKRLVLHTTAKNYKQIARNFVLNKVDNWFLFDHVYPNLSDIHDCYENGLLDLISKIKESNLRLELDKTIRYFFISENCLESQIKIKSKEILKKAILGFYSNKKRIEFRRFPESIWTSENELLNLIKKIYPKKTVIDQYTPCIYDDEIKKFVNFRYDIYIKEFKIAFEYQGIQHFQPIEYFGGEQGLNKTKQRDEYKYKMSIQNDIDIIYIKYDEYIDENIIKQKVKEKLSDKEKRKIERFNMIISDQECLLIDEIFIENQLVEDIVISKLNIKDVFKSLKINKVEKDGFIDRYEYKAFEPIDVNFIIYAKIIERTYGFNERKWGVLMYYSLIKAFKENKYFVDTVIIEMCKSFGENNLKRIYFYGGNEIDDIISSAWKIFYDLKERYKLYRKAKKYFNNHKNS